jgi:hypothetical protein
MASNTLRWSAEGRRHHSGWRTLSIPNACRANASGDWPVIAASLHSQDKRASPAIGAV